MGAGAGNVCCWDAGLGWGYLSTTNYPEGLLCKPVVHGTMFKHSMTFIGLG